MLRFLGTIGTIGALVAGWPADSKPVSRLAGILPNKIDTGHQIDLEATVACTPERSFAMWSTEAGAKSFFAPNAEIDDEPGGKYTVMFFPDEDPRGATHGTEGAHVLATEPPTFLAFEWVVFSANHTKGRNAPPYAPEGVRRPGILPTWVELSFAAVDGGTHITFRHFGFKDDALWEQSRQWFTGAWGGVLTQMKVTCENSHESSSD